MGQVQSARILRLSAVREWREEGLPKDWRKIREAVLKRDDFTCFYCGIRSLKYMNVHHKEGRHYDNSPENLITLCPLCHSCHHIGHAGINEFGKLLLLKEEVNQALVNGMILKGADVSTVYEMLPVEADFGPEGLVELANMILNGFVPDGRFLFFPNPDKYEIIKFLKENRK